VSGSGFLVSGTSGLLGKKVVEILLEQNEDVSSIGRSMPGFARGKVIEVEADFSKNTFTTSGIRIPETVVHLSQSRHYQEFPNRAVEIFDVNLRSTVDLLASAHAASSKSFLLASTGGVYRPSGRMLHEDSVLAPPGSLNFYLATKFAAEAFARTYDELMEIAILRYFFIYGPGQAETMLIPRLVNRVLAGEPITVDGENGTLVSPIFVDDAAQATVAAAKGFSGTVNIAGSEEWAIGDIARAIGRLAGTPANVIPSGRALPHNLIADASRMRAELHKPKIGLLEGLARVVEDSQLSRN